MPPAAHDRDRDRGRSQQADGLQRVRLQGGPGPSALHPRARPDRARHPGAARRQPRPAARRHRGGRRLHPARGGREPAAQSGADGRSGRGERAARLPDHRSGAAFDTVSELLTGYTEEVWPDVDPLSRSLAVEAVVRLTASHLLQSSADPEQSGRAEAVRRIAEIVMRVSGVVDPRAGTDRCGTDRAGTACPGRNLTAPNSRYPPVSFIRFR
ncbi:hypothetical protein [Kitasatospora viridis]|uniref:hypothetical protein n=1 Tax=Kitasatospora viridis TaxID=281105 RepID=UPI003CCC55C3